MVNVNRKKIVTVKAGLNLSGFDGALNNYADAGYVLHTVLYVKNAGYVLAVMTLREDPVSDFKPEFVGDVPEHNDYDSAVAKGYVAEEDKCCVAEKKRTREFLREAFDTDDSPVAERVEDPISDTVSEPVADIVSDPVPDMVSEPVTDIVSEPVADIVSEPVPAMVSELVTDIVSEPGADIVSEPEAGMVSAPAPVADTVSEPAAGALEAVPTEETCNVPNAETVAAILESRETEDLSTLSDLNELADLNDLNSGEPETN